MDCKCEICSNNRPFEMPIEIVEAAKKGKLALFCGAGISTENRIVLPYSLYSEIQHELNIDDNTLSFSEVMERYCHLPNGRRKLLTKIRDRFEYIHSFPELERRATKFHKELQEIYLINTIITTNWDTYFEDFCGAIPIIIPEDVVFWNANERCVLKIHGSINNLGSIVATKEDYSKCLERLERGIVGSTLKTVLANDTVIFIGFSFGDEDLLQILNYLREEMKSLLPHIYIVTMDDRMNQKIVYENCTIIVTDGTFFLHELKNILKKDGFIVNCKSMPYIEDAYHNMLECHDEVSKIDITQFPCNIYCLAYQDGILHAFERFMQLYYKGCYNIPGIIEETAEKYEEMAINSKVQKDFWDEAYYEGYLNGLVLIRACDKDPSVVSSFPFFFLPNSSNDIISYSAYMDELHYFTERNDIYNEISKEIAEKHKGEDIVIHHPPY